MTQSGGRTGEYRWNQIENARGFDAAAQHIHPYYVEIQNVILDRLATDFTTLSTVADLGGGSGRLAERILDRFPTSRVWVIDQSEPFLALARERLARFGSRAVCMISRLQSNWSADLGVLPDALVSMSAIHHLDPAEKQRLYHQCFDCLVPGGVLLNGDEVRPVQDADYLAECQRWVSHKQAAMQAGLIPEPLHATLRGWEARNVHHFGEPRVSGDDCHETAETQLGYFQACGFSVAETLWKAGLWAVLFAKKAL